MGKQNGQSSVALAVREKFMGYLSKASADATSWSALRPCSL